MLIAVVFIVAATTSVSAQNSEWTTWSACSRTCGVGISKRTKICKTPLECLRIRNRIHIRTCIMKSCQNYCGQWSPCSETCGYGVRMRRSCTTGAVETTQCFSPCNQVCENSIMGVYRHPSSPCCEDMTADGGPERAAPGECGVGAPLRQSLAAMNEKESQKAFPWTVRVKVDSVTCLGAIVNERYVITAAKCVHRKNPLSITVNAGSTKSHWFDPELRYGRDVQFRAVKRVIIYPRFNHINYASYNIALLELRQPFRFVSDFIAPICLPQGETVPDGSTCVAFDFITSSKTLSPTDLRILPIDDCTRSLGNVKIGTKKASLQISDERTVCAGQILGTHYNCQGTAGAALMCQRCSSCRWMLYGVTSHGDKRCTTVTRPGVFAKTAFFESWIMHQMGMKKSEQVFPSCPSN